MLVDASQAQTQAQHLLIFKITITKQFSLKLEVASCSVLESSKIFFTPHNKNSLLQRNTFWNHVLAQECQELKKKKTSFRKPFDRTTFIYVHKTIYFTR